MKKNDIKYIEFKCNEFILYGSLHLPSDNTVSKETGIVMINAGPTDRSGPHGLYTRLAKYFNNKGYPTLRFDPRGVGESKGYWSNVPEKAPNTELYRLILNGIWFDDVNAAIRTLMAETQVRNIILYGHCGGAIAALHAGASNKFVNEMYLSGMPITKSAYELNIRELPEEIIESDYQKYMRKLVNIKYWFRFITFKTDYKTIMEVFKTKIKNTLFKRKQKTIIDDSDKLTNIFKEAFYTCMLQNKKLTLIYGEKDYLCKEFQQYFEKGKNRTFQYNFYVIPNSNHNITELEWQNKLFSIMDTIPTQ